MKRNEVCIIYSYNAQNAVYETVNPTVAVVKTHIGTAENCALADARYCSQAVINEFSATQPETELVIAPSDVGNVLAERENAMGYQHAVAMVAKFQPEHRKLDYRKRKWTADPPKGWIKNILSFDSSACRSWNRQKPS